MQAVKRQVTVQAGGVIEIRVPEFTPGTVAEVIVLESFEPRPERTLTSFIGKGKGCFTTPEEADAFLRKERQLWD